MLGRSCVIAPFRARRAQSVPSCASVVLRQARRSQRAESRPDDMCDTGRIGGAVKQDRRYARHNPDWPWQTGISHRVVLFKGCWRRYGWDLESTDCRRQAAKFLDAVTVTLRRQRRLNTRLSQSNSKKRSTSKRACLRIWERVDRLTGRCAGTVTFRSSSLTRF